MSEVSGENPHLSELRRIQDFARNDQAAFLDGLMNGVWQLGYDASWSPIHFALAEFTQEEATLIFGQALVLLGSGKLEADVAEEHSFGGFCLFLLRSWPFPFSEDQQALLIDLVRYLPSSSGRQAIYEMIQTGRINVDTAFLQERLRLEELTDPGYIQTHEGRVSTGRPCVTILNEIISKPAFDTNLEVANTRFPVDTVPEVREESIAFALALVHAASSGKL